MDHTTGKGYVEQQDGHYADALRKGHTVICVIVEALGGITPQPMAHMRHLARRSAGPGASDRTAYGTARGSTKSFLTHHMQQISRAAAMYDAMAILKALTGKKQEMCKSAQAGCAAAHAVAGGAQA